MALDLTETIQVEFAISKSYPESDYRKKKLPANDRVNYSDNILVDKKDESVTRKRKNFTPSKLISRSSPRDLRINSTDTHFSKAEEERLQEANKIPRAVKKVRGTLWALAYYWKGKWFVIMDKPTTKELKILLAALPTTSNRYDDAITFIDARLAEKNSDANKFSKHCPSPHFTLYELMIAVNANEKMFARKEFYNQKI